MKIKFSFKIKLALYYTIIVLSILIIFYVVILKLVEKSLYQDFDNSLEAEAIWVQNVLNEYQIKNFSSDQMREDISRRSRISPRKQFIDIYDKNGNNFFRSVNLGNDNLKINGITDKSITTIKNFRGHEVRIIVLTDQNYEIIIGYTLTDINAAISEIFSTILWIIPLVLFLIFFGGIIIVNKFTKPLKDLNIYIDKLLQQPLDQDIEKIAVPIKDEIGDLVTRINFVTEKMRNSTRQSLSFSSLAAHELRSPLAIIRSQLENVLQSDTSLYEIKTTLTSIYDELLRLNRIINDLLCLGTLQAGTFNLEFENIELGSLLKEFYEEAMLLCRQKNISVVLKSSDKVNVRVDVLRIRQVLFNLLDNSIRNTPENGRIRLGYQTDEKYATIFFSDTGSGIPQHLVPKIFNTFLRGISKNGNLIGAGLGLSLVKSIIDAHNGNIYVESELDKGTTFILTLPISHN